MLQPKVGVASISPRADATPSWQSLPKKALGYVPDGRENMAVEIDTTYKVASYIQP
jgi:hypothetical protein